MNHESTIMRRRGFTLIECAAAVLVGGALLAIFQPVMGDARRGARMQTSQDNLRFWGVASGTYTSDFGGLMPAYSWQPGETHNFAGFGGLKEGAPITLPSNQGGISAVGFQETDLLRRLTGRAVGERKIRLYQAPLFPNRRRTHLVLADHFGFGAANRRAADPQDRLLLTWQRDPIAFEDRGVYPTLKGTQFGGDGPTDPIVQRWPYSSSYRTIPASYSVDARIGSATTIGPVSNSSNFFTSGNLPIGNRFAIEVAFPAQKVFMFEWHDRHSSDQGLWYAYPEAKPNKLMFDGSVNDLATGGAGLGFNPNDPDNPESFFYRYEPLSTEPPPVGDPDAFYPVSFRFTRNGLAGIDYSP